MNTRKKKHLRILLFAATLAVLPFVIRTQSLTACSGGKLLFAWPISNGQRFCITFTHSLNLSPITDMIEWNGEEMVVRKSIFTAFGAGVPVPSDGVGTKLARVGDHYELTGIDARMQSIPILTSQVPDHRVAMAGREAHLLEYVGSGQPVELAVRWVSLAERAATYL